MTNSFCLRFAGTLLPRRAAWPGDNDSSRTAGNHRQRLWAKPARGFHIKREGESREHACVRMCVCVCVGMCRFGGGGYLNWLWGFIALVKLLIANLHSIMLRLHLKPIARPPVGPL